MSQFEVRNRFHSQGLAAGSSALLDAVNKGKVHLAKFILDAGENDVVNTRDFKGKTPLIRACYIKEEKTREKLIQLLLSKSAGVNLTDDSRRTALSYACELRCNDVVRILVKNNVDPDIPDCQGNTALIYSASVGNDVAIDILIRSFRRLGLGVDHVNDDGLTALLVASKGGFIECATMLATDGRANVSLRDPQNGMTAEDWLRMRGCSSPEVLPFRACANQRLTRCGSTYGQRRSTDASAGVGMYTSAAQNSPAAAAASAQSGGFVKVEQVSSGVGGCHGDGNQHQSIGGEGKDGKGRLTGLSAFVRPRRKRNSLPTIKLWSSLDLPNQRSTSSPVYEESPPLNSPAAVPPATCSHASSLPLRKESKMAAETSSESSTRLLRQRGIATDKLRDLASVDTEISLDESS